MVEYYTVPLHQEVVIDFLGFWRIRADMVIAGLMILTIIMRPYKLSRIDIEFLEYLEM